MTNTYLKRNYINIKNDKYISDDGWLLENNRKINYLSYENVNTEVNNIANTSPYDILLNTFESPYIGSVTNRSYTKVQNLLANLGGVVNAFTITLQVFFTHYLRYLFNLNLRKFLNPKESNPTYDSQFINIDKNEKAIQDGRQIALNNENPNLKKLSNEPILNELMNKNNFYYALENKIVPYNIIPKETNPYLSHISLNNYINTKNEEYIQDNNNENRYETRKMKPRSLFSKVEINKIDDNSLNNNSNNAEVNKSNQNLEKSNIKLFKQDKQDNKIEENKFTKMNNAFTKSNNKSNVIIKNTTEFDLNINNLSINKNKGKVNIISFNKLSFEGINYLKFIYYKITCNKNKIRPYKIIIKEIDKFLDFLTFCNYLKSQYEKHSINSNYDPSFD